MTITLKKLSITVLAWGLLFAELASMHLSPFGLQNIIGFPFLILVPGYLLLHVLRMERLTGPMKVLFSIVFSLALLIFWPLLGNAILPGLHIARPLDTIVLIPEMSLLVVLLWALVGWRHKWQWAKVVDTCSIQKVAKRDVLFAALPLVFVGLSIMGATSLNNGGNNAFTIAMLVAMTIYIAALIYYAERLRQGTVLIAIFLLSASLLFMTSLRGWYITGHDVQHEFRLFIQAADAGKWYMGNAKDAYNACMSITVLPTVLYRLLDVQTFYIFKVLFQIIFSLVPCIVFILSRQFLKDAAQRAALLATLYFVSFPTFFSDMPMLNRQEIALVFAGLMIWLIFDRTLSLWTRRIAFSIMGVSVVVSHYSTNYTMLALIAAGVVAMPILRLWSNKAKPTGRIYKALNLEVWRKRTKQSLVTLPMLIIVVVASFVWSVQLTNSSGQLTKVFFDTLAHIRLALGEDSPSQDTYFSYGEVDKLDDKGKLERYVEQLAKWSHDKNKSSSFYDPSTYNKYSLDIIKDEPVPLTPMGQVLAHAGVPVQLVSSVLRNGLTRFLQLMMLVGVFMTLFVRRYNNVFTEDYRLLQIGAVFLVGLMLVLPVLMVDYDLLRMTQQLLLFMGTAFAIASTHLLPKASRKVNMAIASLAVVVMFTTMTGTITAVLGGYNAQLNLYNSGIYYRLYYTHREDEVGTQWISGLLDKSRASDLQVDNIFVDRYTYVKSQSLIQFDLLNDIAPPLVKKNSYVFLGYNVVKNDQATIYYNGALITYKYPMKFLDDNKNLLYNNGGAKVYR